MKSIFYLSILIFAGTIISCDVKKSNISPEATFVKVYESSNVDEAYYPEAIIELSDKNYLVLSAIVDSNLSNFPGISVMALSSAGEVISSVTLPVNYSNPVAEWIQTGEHTYFVCMDDVSMQAKLIEVILTGTELSYNEQMEFDRKMPLSVWNDGQNTLMLSYERLGRNTIIDRYDQNMNSIWGTQVSTNEDFEGLVRLHFQRKGKTLPFFIGGIGNGSSGMDYYVNCLANYSMAMLFFSGSSGTETGRLYSYQEGTAISAALHMRADTFSLSRYHSGDNYVFPLVEIDRNALQNTQDFQDILMSQLKADSRMDVIKYTLEDKEYVVFVATSKSNQIVLIFLDAETGEQSKTHYLGYGNPVEVVSLIQTQDDGLAVLGKTWINGQYQRIIFYKVSRDLIGL
jgi:hypothetical protein